MQYCTYEQFYSNLSSAEKKVAPQDIFIAGDFCIATESINVSVVGARNASPEGIKKAESITEFLVSLGITVVSGLASGIDTAAHNTAIKFGGKTIAVLGTSLDKCSPAANRTLLETIKKDHLAISQFSQGSIINKSNFPQRNKLMALISDATIVIEASEESGTRHQAWEAIRLNRQVFIFEEIINDPSVLWAKKTLDYGAKIVTKDNYREVLSSIVEYA